MALSTTISVEDGIVIDIDSGDRALIAGPVTDFQAVSKGNTAFWIAGQLANQSAANLVREVLEDRRFDTQNNEPFSAIIQDEDRKVSVVSDRYGGVPLYTVDDGKNTWISTRLTWLIRSAGIQVRPDEQSLAELLTFKFILGTPTIVRGVSRVPPASINALDSSGRWRSSEYWRAIPPSQRASLESQAANLTQTFTAAVRRGIGDAKNIGITLSGGLDSRAILAASLQTDVEITTLTTAIPHGMDYRYASAAAAAAGVPNIRAILDSEYHAHFFDLAAESLEIYEGMLLTPGTESLWLIRQLGDQRFDRVMHGALGELAKGASANHFSVALSDINSARKDIAGYLAAPYLSSHEQLVGMLNPSLASELKGLAIQSLKDRVNDLSLSMDPLDVSFAMQIREHFRNSGVYSGKIWSRKCPIVFPFADPAYVDQLLSIRAEDRLRPELHRRMIGALHSELYNCPESNTGCKVSASPAVRKLSELRVRVSKKLGSRRTSGHTDYCSWINNMTPGVEKVLLGDSAMCRELWNHKQIPNRIAECRAGNRSAAIALYRMVSVELIFRALDLSWTSSVRN